MAGADEAAGPDARRPNHFDVVIRGYNTRQVNERVTRLEFDLRTATRERDLARAGNAELAKRLGAAEEELTVLRARVRQLADSPVTGDNVNERVRMMLDLAQEEIAEHRRAAERELAEQRAELAQRRAQLEHKYTEHNDALDREYDELKSKLAREHEQLMARARADAAKTTRLAEERAALTVREADEHARQQTAAADEHTARMRALHDEFRDRLIAARAAANQAAAELERMADE
jgi:V/A-type H+-transporting ATPase subunit G/H